MHLPLLPITTTTYLLFTQLTHLTTALPTILPTAHQKPLNEPSLFPGRIVAPPSVSVAHDTTTTVGLAFKTSDSLDASVTYVEIPLRRRVGLDDMPGLPRHPMSAGITGVFKHIVSTPYSRNDPNQPEEGEEEIQHLHAYQSRVICMAYPKVRDDEDETWLFGRSSPRHSSTSRVSRSGKERPVWWRMQDGVVDFEDARARWWLKGQEVGGYECM